MDESMFSDGSDASEFDAPVKAKAKPAPKKPAAAKPKAALKAAAAKKQTTLKPSKVAPKKRAAESDDSDDGDEEVNSDNDASLLSTTPPSSKKQKKDPAPKKSSGKPLMEIDNESFANGITASPKLKKGTNSDKYQKLTQLEHILKRPDTYIGSVERTDQQMWVFNSSTEVMESREVSFVPGLYKIFDEILVNAADNKQRDKNMNEIRVWVDREKGEIAVKNNGRGIPIEIHDKEKIYIPEMIFGHLLTGSNYDDDEQKTTGGRNGYGAKLANIFSTEFTLETADSKHGKKYKQTWRNNMSVAEKAKITAHKGDDFTKITFRPDFAKFKMDQMDDDFEALVKRRVYDMAGTCGVKVYLNDMRIKVTKFKQYMEMYTKAIKAENGEDAPTAPERQVILTDNPNERWEVGFAVSDGSFQQVSFVNSIATTSGGTHVNYIADQIVNKLAEIVKKKNKGGVVLKNAQIKNHMFLFVNCSIVNPAFTSQTKEQLTTKFSQFGSKCTVSEKFLKDIAKTEVITNILDFAQKKADQAMKKSDGNRRTRMNNSKLTDANKAGTRDGYKCTLILTEGDSASLLALAGRAVVNPDLFGVFPLRGKLLNVRDASVDAITKNAEIQNIKKFMGLQHKKDYTDTHGLRYGHLMIMTDQDHDGSHIKGLLINFLQCQFPSLLKLPGFLLEFITPIVKVWKGDIKQPKQKRDFFTMPEYEAWRQEPGHSKGWEHKYYKGLGTSDTTDAEIYFADLDKHLKTFHTLQEHENQLIDLAFSKKKADERKQWLGNFVPGTFLDMSGTEAITYDDFINKELILFSMADNQRSIPSVMDGFKPGQRKVLYTCFRRNLKKDVKVVELAGSVSGLTAYAYGDTSLQQTIVGLAQNFVGSNNINTLEPSGNFGSRLQGGSDAASARYIYTRLSPFARKIFNQSDEPLLTYNTDDGKTIEPETYMPVLPMILVNGADGIGTGWSTSIPNYRPEDIIENLKRRMKGNGKDDMMAMKPWFRGYNGEAEDIGSGRFKFGGILRADDDKCEVEITELPVRIWTQDFKDKLEEVIRAEKTPSFIKDYIEYNTPSKVHFIIKMTESDYAKAKAVGFEDQFKLSKSMGTTNLVAFDSQGRIHRYETVLDIMEEFYHVRLDFYGKRKAYLLSDMNRELDRLSNQARFVQMIIDNKLVVSKKKKSVLVTELQKLGFTRFPKVVDARKDGEFEKVVEEGSEETEEDIEIGAGDYDYLLGMAIWSLTQERVERLLKQIGDKEMEIDVLTRKSPKDLWCEDLDGLLEEWQIQLDDDAKRSKKSANKTRRASAKLGIGAKSKKRKAGDSDDDDFEFESGPKKKAASKPKAQKPIDNWLSAKDKKPAGVYAGLFDTDGNPIDRPPAEKQGLIKPASKPASAVEALKAMVAMKPAAKSAVKEEESDVEMVDAEPAAKRDPKPASKPRAAASKPKKKIVDSDDESEDDFHDIEEIEDEPAKEPAPAPKADGARKGRAAAKKAKKYAISDEEDESDFDDNALGDLSAMVKGTLKGAAGKPLLTTSASRPTSTNGIKTTVSRKIGSDDVDDTDWGQLAATSPKKPEKFSTIDADDDSILLSTRKPIVKTVSALTGKTNGTAVAAKDKLKKAAAVSVVKALSPAAKAYAAKKAAAAKPVAKPAAKPYKRAADSEDEDLADELLSDDDDLDSPAPKKAPAARPSRRAAATKSKYVVDDDEGEEDEASEAEEPSFEEDESFD